MTRRALPLLPALLAPLVVLAASVLKEPFVLPIGAAAACYPVLVLLLLRGRPLAAVGAVLLWSLTLSGSLIATTAHDPDAAASWVAHGAAYRDEMFSFIATGKGREADPSRFVPQHTLHLAAFVLLSLASAGLFGIVLGAVLIGYMSYYVGALAAAGGAPWTAVLLGWPPYAVLRVVAYVLLGVALTRPLLERFAGRRLPDPPGAAFYRTAAALLVADVVLKTLCAPRWATLLRACLSQS